MPSFLCPVCSGPLHKQGACWRCGEGHSYDIAHQGYVNLLMRQQSSEKRHGDDKLMVEARKNFLDRGYYLPLRDAVVELSRKYCHYSQNVLDIGCGEGWYTEGVRSALPSATITGIDISREAIKAATGRSKMVYYAVASAYDLPIADGSQDLCLNLFAPLSESETRRVTAMGGYLIRVMPDIDHLYELKEKIYEAPRKNDVLETALYGFEIVEEKSVAYKMHLENTQDILELFMMTPYYYKTGADDQAKLTKLASLDTGAAFKILVYRRIK